MIPVLIHVRPLNRATGERVDIRVGSAAEPTALGLGGFPWEPIVARRPRLAQELMSPEIDGSIKAASADLVLALGMMQQRLDGEQLHWPGAPVTIYRVDSLSWQDRLVEFKGRVRTSPYDLTTKRLSLNLMVDVDRFERDLLTEEFGGGGYYDGEPELRGTLKPAGFGYCENAEPVWIDTAYNIGMLDGYGNLLAVHRALEGLNSWGPSVGDFADYAALRVALENGVIPAGRWGTSIAAGLVGLGAPPTGVMTFEAEFGCDRPGEMMVRWLNLHADVDLSEIDQDSFAALDIAVPRDVRRHFTDQVKVGSLIQELCRSCNATPLVTAQGQIAVTRAVKTPEFGTLNRNGQTDPRPIGWGTLDAIEPVYKVSMRAEIPERVLSYNEVNYADELLDRGLFSMAATYRQGNIVWLPNGSQWLYHNETAASNNAPPANITQVGQGDAFWTLMQPPASASNITYADGTPIETLKPGEAGANVTEARTAAAITGQGAFATKSSAAYGTEISGLPTALRPDQIIFGGYVSAANTSYVDGVTVSGLRPGEAGANVTESRTAAAFTGQGGLATVSQITGDSQLGGSIAWRMTPFPGDNNYLLAGRVAWEGTGGTVQGWKPGEPGANVTEGRTASAISGQGAFATLSSVDLNDSNRFGYGGRFAPSSFGPSWFNANNVAWAGGSTVELLKPGEAGANVTENRTASAIAGQGAFATISSAGYGSSYLTGFDLLATKGNVKLGTSTPYWAGVIDENNAYYLTNATAVTSLGTAAAFYGQGALATKSQATWATDIIGTGKPANNAGTSGVLTPIGQYTVIVGNTTSKGSPGTHGVFQGGAVGSPLRGSAFISSSIINAAGGGGWITPLALDNDRTSFAQADQSYYADVQVSGDPVFGRVLLWVGGVAHSDTGFTIPIRPDSVFALAYDGTKVRVLVDGVSYLEAAAPANLTLYPKALDFYLNADYLVARTDVLYGPFGENAWSSIAGLGRPTDNADVTGSNISAGIVGQGLLATKDSIDWQYVNVDLGGDNRIPNSMLADGLTKWTLAGGAGFQAAGNDWEWPAPGAIFIENGQSGAAYANATGRMAVQTDRQHMSAWFYREANSPPGYLYVQCETQGGAIIGWRGITLNPTAVQVWQRLGGWIDLPPGTAKVLAYWERGAQNGRTYMTGMRLSSLEPSATKGAAAGRDLYRADGATVFAQAEVATSEGTAAAISGQGAFATISSAAYGSSLLTGFAALAATDRVKLGSGNGMVDETNSYWLTSPIVVTGQGTASGIAGQGSLATQNYAEWGSQIGSRPAELTDGRIGTALTAGGNLKGGLAAGGGVAVTLSEALAQIGGTSIAVNPEFTDGSMAGYAVYDNGASGLVSLYIQGNSVAKNSSGYQLLVSKAAGLGTNPGWGGFYIGLADGGGVSRPGYYARNSLIYFVVNAYIPAGRRLEFATNQIGTGYTHDWVTPNDGISNWRTYVLRVKVGDDGTFSSTGYFYVDGGDASAFNWWVARCDVIDTTSAHRQFLGNTTADELGVKRGRLDLVTTLGQAASISGQGGLATVSQITGDSQLGGSIAWRMTPFPGDNNYLLAGRVAWEGTGGTVQGWKPGEPGANVTEGRTASAISGQGAFATLSSVDLNDSNRFGYGGRFAPSSFGPSWFNANNVAWAGGSTVELLKPGEAGANVTENRTAAALSGQGSLATRNNVDWSAHVIGSGRPADNAGTAGKLKAIGVGTVVRGNTTMKVGGPGSTHGSWQGGAVGSPILGTAFIACSIINAAGGGGWLTALALDDEPNTFNFDADQFFAAQLVLDSTTGSILGALTVKVNGAVYYGGGFDIPIGPDSYMLVGYDGVRLFVQVDGLERYSTATSTGHRFYPKTLDFYLDGDYGLSRRDVVYGPWSENAWSSIGGANRPTNNADVTGANTAAGFVGQGALATKGNVKFGTSTDYWAGIIDENNSYYVTNAQAITSLGTAAAFYGQGAFSTLSYVNLDNSTYFQHPGRFANTSPHGANYLDSNKVAWAAGDVLENWKPGEPGANKTETRTSAGISGQGSLATQNSVDTGTINAGATSSMVTVSVANIHMTANGTVGSITFPTLPAGTTGVMVIASATAEDQSGFAGDGTATFGLHLSLGGAAIRLGYTSKQRYSNFTHIYVDTAPLSGRVYNLNFEAVSSGTSPSTNIYVFSVQLTLVIFKR